MAEYLRNAWYAAAWAEEVEGKLFSAMICDERILIYRKGDGALTAIQDRCPHRFAPLSLGKREGDAVVCGYHGLKFDSAGQCVHNPFSDTIPAAAKVRAFPVHEKDTMVWIWMGDVEAADPASIPDFPFMNDPMAGRGRIRMEANYELITDNLMDLSHIEYVHAGTFGGQGVIFQGKHEVIQDGETIHSNWWMPNINPTETLAHRFPPGAKMDHWLNMRWNAPASMFLDIGAIPAGSPRGPGGMPTAHILTPETSASTQYLVGYVKESEDDGANLIFEAFELEDKAMLEAVQTNMGNVDFWSQKPLLLNVDAGAVRVRRVLAQMMERERQVQAA